LREAHHVIFHTHPEYGYETDPNQAGILPPSPGDIVNIVKRCYNGQCLFEIVVTREGLYIMSFSDVMDKIIGDVVSGGMAEYERYRQRLFDTGIYILEEAIHGRDEGIIYSDIFNQTFGDKGQCFLYARGGKGNIALKIPTRKYEKVRQKMVEEGRPSDLVVASLNEPISADTLLQQNIEIEMIEKNVSTITCNPDPSQFPFNIILKDKLGSGQHGTVYSACVDEKCDKQFALKRTGIEYYIVDRNGRISVNSVSPETWLGEIKEVTNMINGFIKKGISPNFLYTYSILYCPLETPTLSILPENEWSETIYAKIETLENTGRSYQEAITALFMRTGFIYTLSELGGVSIERTLKRKDLPLIERMSIYIQLLHAMVCLGFNDYVHLDTHVGNILEKKVEEDTYYEYEMFKHTFYVPTYGRRVIVIDYEAIRRPSNPMTIYGVYGIADQKAREDRIWLNLRDLVGTWKDQGVNIGDTFDLPIRSEMITWAISHFAKRPEGMKSLVHFGESEFHERK